MSLQIPKFLKMDMKRMKKNALDLFHTIRRLTANKIKTEKRSHFYQASQKNPVTSIEKQYQVLELTLKQRWINDKFLAKIKIRDQINLSKMKTWPKTYAHFQAQFLDNCTLTRKIFVGKSFITLQKMA
jgi:hypothetical protein